MGKHKGEVLLAFLFSLLAMAFYGMAQFERDGEIDQPAFPLVIASETDKTG